MLNDLLKLIEQIDTIIIIRHKKPDLDALGSQIGLKHLINDNFKNKNVFVFGDMTQKCFLGDMDEYDEDKFNDALVILTDVSNLNMIDPYPLNKAKAIYVLDHHKNVCDIDRAITYYDTSACAACQIVAEFALKNNLHLSVDSLNCLYSGIITDSNRFLYSLSDKVFNIAGELVSRGANYQDIYSNLYNDTLYKVKMRAYFTNKFEVDSYGVGFMFNDLDVFDKYKVDIFTISRGMVNVMANISEVKIWCNFTKNPLNNKVVCEFRSRNIPILDIAIKYGGGGHLYACGATIDSFDVAKKIIRDFDELLKEN